MNDSPRLYDAHNHLQDERLGSDPGAIVATVRSEGVVAMVVNGAAESDWPAVAELAGKYPEVIPSFGYHPWYVKARMPGWEQRLIELLDHVPSGIGEIGLDNWVKDRDSQLQEEMFLRQLCLAVDRDLPVSIHCLQAWGRLYEILRVGPRPGCGFVLHSFGGPVELIQPLARLGAYFSLPGYFAHERKARQRESFRHVPLDRLLIETDAPDQTLPKERVRYPLSDSAGKPLNHPANLPAVYLFAAELLGLSLDSLAARVEENFLRLFGRFMRPF